MIWKWSNDHCIFFPPLHRGSKANAFLNNQIISSRGKCKGEESSTGKLTGHLIVIHILNTDGIYEMSPCFPKNGRTKINSINDSGHIKMVTLKNHQKRALSSSERLKMKIRLFNAVRRIPFSPQMRFRWKQCDWQALHRQTLAALDSVYLLWPVKQNSFTNCWSLQ